MGGSQSELIEWTGQASAPVVAWNDERPRTSWIDQLNLAERLAPDPPLIPERVEDRVLMFGEKYGYSEAAAERAARRIETIVTAFANQLKSQQAGGRRYLVGDRLSALDIDWAACCGILDPLPPDRCPMTDGFRGPYGNTDPRIDKALTRELREHRDRIYAEHLELPIVF